MFNEGSGMSKLEWRYGRYAIRNLMKYIVIGMGAVYILDLLVYAMTHVSLGALLTFDRELIMRGQVWRIISFIIMPPSSSVIFILFTLYFYYTIGVALENQWGAFKFNLFYLTGVLGAIISGFITGGSTNYYLNMSLFFAFAILYPDFQINLFFFLPLKVKYLAYLDAALFLIMLILDSWPGKLALILSLANLALFFWGDLINRINQLRRRRRFKNAFK